MSQSVPAHDTSLAGCDASRLDEYAKANGMLSKWRVQEEGGAYRGDVRLGPPGFPMLWWKAVADDPQVALDKAIGFALLFYQK